MVTCLDSGMLARLVASGAYTCGISMAFRAPEALRKHIHPQSWLDGVGNVSIFMHVPSQTPITSCSSLQLSQYP